MSKWLQLLVGALISAPSFGWADARLQQHPTGIWTIADAPNQERRWIIIHNLEAGARSGVFHIEVIGRGKAAPGWKVRHITDHMAITEAALSHTIGKPLNKGGVYPESYQQAYKAWMNENGGKGGVVCQTSVAQCLQAR